MAAILAIVVSGVIWMSQSVVWASQPQAGATGSLAVVAALELLGGLGLVLAPLWLAGTALLARPAPGAPESSLDLSQDPAAPGGIGEDAGHA